jgi:hypothetical protein
MRRCRDVGMSVFAGRCVKCGNRVVFAAKLRINDRHRQGPCVGTGITRKAPVDAPHEYASEELRRYTEPCPDFTTHSLSICCRTLQSQYQASYKKPPRHDGITMLDENLPSMESRPRPAASRH